MIIGYKEAEIPVPDLIITMEDFRNMFETKTTSIDQTKYVGSAN